MRRSVTPAAILAFLLVCTACGADDSEGGTAAPTGTPPPSVSTDPPPSDAATEAAEETSPPAETAPPVPDELDFTAPTVGGGTFEGASLAGQPAVLWFWAPWCPVCQGEAPTIADLAAEYEGEVTFVGVAGLSGDLAAMEGFIADGGVGGITHIDDRDGEVYTHFGVTQQYDIGFVSPEGTVDIVSGPLDEAEIADRVEELAAG
ncbi:thiol-disulfide isomerase/thioredoxin [Haloactinopolyspora alba]|uniref:Thiol-disulfide isomerase/thioredoxin n=1 Tax=Haloactinopolyspora alba TaxID=648780 RepID=A0A2P8E9M3_9ACTN|nr:redoxin domain-containing protein [Haloactinopolyspora alba]PSL06150.1 thiol-disulfide isomerase/thioredoxin [Haloactinopolyspora alba]